MRQRFLRLLPWLGMIALALFTWTRPAVSTPAPEHHPHIHAAVVELREARTELQHAAHDFCGHRKQAVEDVNAALRQLEAALTCDHK
ncbi:MAG: hypothetical protein HY238_25325 [Acidobacteria bacterium]|nr:hypothetical protein [Acidobacteriota bacterium]